MLSEPLTEPGVVLHRRERRSRAAIPNAAVEAVLLLAIVGVAAAFRLHDLASAPPGLYGDEAANGLDVLFTIPERHPVFFEANNGREPLFIYLQAAAVALLGPSVLALRLTAVVVGVATTLATYWVGRAWFGRPVGLLAGLGLATSFWHVDLSRIGLRAILAPLLLALALALFWRGLRRGSAVALGLAGLAVSLGLYTYLSGRFGPPLFLAILVWELLVVGRATLRRWPGLALCALVAVAATAPLAVYFAQHPDYLTTRAAQVSIFNPNPVIEARPATFVENLGHNLGMFFVRGDENPRHNLPGRPVFTLLGAPWLLVGLAVAGRSAGGALASAVGAAVSRRPTGPDSGVGVVGIASGWLLLWAVVAFAPGILSHESPNFLRLTALAPAVYLIWAIGLARAARWVAGLGERAAHRPVGVALAGVLALGTLGYEAALTYRDYFHEWAGRADVYQTFDSGLPKVAALVESTASPDTSLYFYFDNHRFRAVEYLSPASRGARWLQGYSNVLLLPGRADADALYVFSDFGYGADVAGRFLGAFRPDRVERDPAGNLVFSAYHLDRSELSALREQAKALERPFGDEVTLLGATVDRSTARPGERVGVTMLWRQETDWQGVHSPYLHVDDERGRGWGQADAYGFAAAGWRAGDLFLSRHEWVVPIDAPPLTYRLSGGMGTRPFGWPPGPATAVGAPVELGRVRVDRPVEPAALPPAPAVAHPVGLDLGAGLHLVGYDGAPGPLKPGESLTLDLEWQARQRPGRDVLVDLSLVDSAGRRWAEDRARPAYGSYSTAEWPAGTLLRDPRALTLGADAPAGRLALVLETLDAATLEPLGRAALGSVEVVAPPRDFALPAMEQAIEATFGGEIALRGFDLDAADLRPGGSVRLTLYWQALATPAKNYTVFTHLLDPSDRIVAQQDNQPDRGQSPTRGWVPGQVVADRYELKLGPAPASGEVALEVGLYDATSGERLPVDGGGETRVILTRLPIGK